MANNLGSWGRIRPSTEVAFVLPSQPSQVRIWQLTAGKKLVPVAQSFKWSSCAATQMDVHTSDQLGDGCYYQNQLSNNWFFKEIRKQLEGRHSTEETFVLPSQPSQVWIWHMIAGKKIKPRIFPLEPAVQLFALQNSAAHSEKEWKNKI